MNHSPTAIERPDINYALVEKIRPPMYRAMKYWGKKPNSIWSEQIGRYCPEGGTIADPFAGSGVAAFEAVKLKRKAIAFDLNPMSSFFIEALASKWSADAFRTAAEQVKEAVIGTDVYRSHYLGNVDGKLATILNYRWEDGGVVAVATESADKLRALKAATPADKRLAKQMGDLEIEAWHPTAKFPNHPSVTHLFLKNVGGATIDHLWTKRNLFILAELFRHIVSITRSGLRLQLLSAFSQTLHLCTKMVIPRHEAAHRDFSGSWGRPDFMIRRRQMEQNPVDVFWRSCVGRQSVIEMMEDVAETFPNGLDVHDAKSQKKIRKSADINYGAIDVADLLDYLKSGSIDFVITDPPYAGLVRYLPLSVVWLAWLERADRKYKPDLNAEIYVDRAPESRVAYKRRLRNAFENVHRMLVGEGRLVVTFHHQEVREFNDFALAVKEAGFAIQKVTHQYNRRSGESNVSNPYGVSGSDFYVRCIKRQDIDTGAKPEEQLGKFLVQKAIEIIGGRNEKTPYAFLFEALWPELLEAGYTQPNDSNDEMRKFLNLNAGPGKIFLKEASKDARIGDLWWFNDPKKYISHPDRPLQDRVADSVLSYLRRYISVKLDDVIAELFREYPNGLTPDPRTVHHFLERYAHKAQGKWKINPDTMIAATRHSDSIATILRIGVKMSLRRFVGRREQAEMSRDGVRLRDIADVPSLNSLTKTFDSACIERLEMVDAVFLKPDSPEIVCLWEVENTTNFHAAIFRGSNAPLNVPKFMVIPESRARELLNFTDPLFLQSFAANGWRYLTYADLARLAGYSAPSLDEITRVSKALGGPPNAL
jgi:16S rRNA G966 N2-methylase RsmD